MKTLLKTVLFALLISMASVCFAEYDYYDNNDGASDQDMIVDLLLVRPLGIVGSAAGLVIHGVGLIFSGTGGNTSEAAEVLIEDPLNYTFNRPLGHFEQTE